MFISSRVVAVSFPYPPMSLTHRERPRSVEPNEFRCGCSAPHLVTKAQGVKLNQPREKEKVWERTEQGKREALRTQKQLPYQQLTVGREAEGEVGSTGTPGMGDFLQPNPVSAR